jgi:hypothetical protein
MTDDAVARQDLDADRGSAPELARRLNHILTTAAMKVGVRYDEMAYHFAALAGEILLCCSSIRRALAAERLSSCVGYPLDFRAPVRAGQWLTT